MWVIKMRIRTAAIWVGFAAIMALPAAGAGAQTAPSAIRLAQAQPPADDAPPVQHRIRRPLRRLPIYPRLEPDGVYPRYDPGPNAVRDCTATYVQEYRPSGTVIVPRMSCYWRRG